MKTVAALMLALCGATAAYALTPETLYVSRHPAMGTVWELYVYASSVEVADEASEAAFDEVDRLDELLSNYKESSELSRINRLAAQMPVVTDPETFQFLSASRHWSEVSGGAFDITVGSLMKAWGFFRKSGHVPTAEELVAVGRETGWRKMVLDGAARSVRFTQKVELDPGGIGKGFAVDAVMRVLRERGVGRAMVSAGGSTIGAIGTPPGEAGWKVVVHDPEDKEREISTVLLRDESLSSANCTEKNFTLGGHRYCHIMNPRTLLPVEGTLQVTIIDASGTASDAMSNVLFVEGARGSVSFLQSYPANRALILSGDAREPVCTAIHWTAPLVAGRCGSEVRR